MCPDWISCAIWRAVAMTEVNCAQVCRQLDRILGSRTFRDAPRLRRFLEFVVLETNKGRGNELKESVVGFGALDKAPSFDPNRDPIVRVHAMRLRERLATYYAEEAQNGEILIEMPKGGYSTSFRARDAATPKCVISMPIARRSKVVVLPFSDCSPGRRLDHFCRGVSQEIVHTLAKLETYQVLAIDPLLSLFVDSKRPEEPSSSVGLLVTGSVRRSGYDLRVTVQIISCISGRCIWSECLGGKRKEIFAIQERVARTVLQRLQTDARRDNCNRGKPTTKLLLGESLKSLATAHRGS
jgi:TolB-like protein